MHRFTSLLLFSLVLLSCSQRPQQPEDSTSGLESDISINTRSAERVIEIARDIRSGATMDDSTWDDLFHTAGYQHYLVYRDSITKREMIKEAMLIVFDTSNSARLDSLLDLTIKLDHNFLKLSLIHNFYSLKNNLEAMDLYLKDTDFHQVLIQADSMARAYLPASSSGAAPDLYPVYVIVSDPDGRVQEGAIILDLNLMYERGPEGLVKFIAHEFHHNYRGLVQRDYEHPLMIELNKLHQEAIADLIDKQTPPVEKLGLAPKSIVAQYNKDYRTTPDKLRRLDSLVVGYLNEEMAEDQFNKHIQGFFKFGGHTNGIYMSFLVNETIGRAQMIESYSDPVKFLAIYNSVASELEGEHVFSDAFMDYVGGLSRKTMSAPTKSN